MLKIHPQLQKKILHKLFQLMRIKIYCITNMAGLKTCCVCVVSPHALTHNIMDKAQGCSKQICRQIPCEDQNNVSLSHKTLRLVVWVIGTSLPPLPPLPSLQDSYFIRTREWAEKITKGSLTPWIQFIFFKEISLLSTVHLFVFEC